jgi:hypothetical protein
MGNHHPISGQVKEVYNIEVRGTEEEEDKDKAEEEGAEFQGNLQLPI